MQVKAHGAWRSGPYAGTSATVVGVSGGRLLAVLEDGKEVLGTATDFWADTGENDQELLELLLPAPSPDDLLHGARRETLACAHSISRLGLQETRVWETTTRYIAADDVDRAALAFLPGMAVGAVCFHDPPRDFDCSRVLLQAPVDQRQYLEELANLPLLSYAGKPDVTAVFWTRNSRLTGGEPWHITYTYGGELIGRELLADEAWQKVATDYWSLDEAAARVIPGIVARFAAASSVVVTRDELEILIPSGSGHRSDAIDMLLGGGVFVLADEA